jgi:hypothetical protein
MALQRRKIDAEAIAPFTTQQNTSALAGNPLTVNSRNILLPISSLGIILISTYLS